MKFKFVIIQLCCFNCSHFEDIYFTNDDYIDFISSLEDYIDYSYIVYRDEKHFMLFNGDDI